MQYITEFEVNCGLLFYTPSVLSPFGSVYVGMK